MATQPTPRPMAWSERPDQPRLVVQVHNQYSGATTGGEDTVVSEESQLLQSMGIEVSLLGRTNRSNRVGALPSLLAAPWNPARYGAMKRHLSRLRPDLVHVHNTWFSFSPSVVTAVRRAGLPVVVTLHNYRIACGNGLLFREGRICTDCVDGSATAGLRHRCYRNSIPGSALASLTIGLNRSLETWARADKIIVLSEFAKRIAVSSGLPEDRILVKNNFVKDAGPRPSRPSESQDVLVVGRLSQEKGILSLVRAWAAHSPPHLVLHVYGDGPDHQQVSELVGPTISVHGQTPRDEILAHMRAARALVIPSVCFEGQPMVALEALSAGLPVFSLGLGWLGELQSAIGLPDWGFLIESPSDWNDALMALTDDHAMDTASLRGRELYEARHSVQSARESFERLFTALCSKSS